MSHIIWPLTEWHSQCVSSTWFAGREPLSRLPQIFRTLELFGLYEYCATFINYDEFSRSCSMCFVFVLFYEYEQIELLMAIGVRFTVLGDPKELEQDDHGFFSKKPTRTISDILGVLVQEIREDDLFFSD